MNAPLTATQFHEAASRLKLPSQAFIDGRFNAASDGGTFENLGPGTGKPLGRVAHCTQTDVNGPVRRPSIARRFSSSWRISCASTPTNCP